MAENELAALYQVHLIDEALLTMKQRATVLDGGKSIRAEFESLKSEKSAELKALADLESGIATAEQKAKDYREKAAAIERHLFSGKVVNPKEIAGYETEMAQFKKMADDAEWQGIELTEQLPEVKATAMVVKRELQKLAKAYEARQVSDREEGKLLQEEYKAKQEQRGSAAARVSKNLLATYDAVRAKMGTGMGLVAGKACGACGTNIPTKMLEIVREDKVASCPSCHRILFEVVPSA